MADISKRLPMSVLEQTEEFLALTPKQQLFIRTYVEGGMLGGHYDPLGSVLTAYQCKTRESARTMVYPLLSNIRILAVLNLHFAREPVEDFLDTLNRAIRNKRVTLTQFRLLELKAKTLGLLQGRLPNAADAIPADVMARDKEERKANRKKPTKASPEPVEVPETDMDIEARNF